MKVIEILSKEIIKPAYPTPPETSIYNLSLFDQINTRTYVPIVYFYTKQDFVNINNGDISLNLKTSLSKTLALYYPFAGSLKDTVTIDCNDEGVLFTEAQINYQLLEFLKNPKDEVLNLLFVEGLMWENWSSSNSYLAVQLNFFKCGGIAIGICISHKLADTSTMCKFINDWAAMTCNKSVEVLELNAASMFPRGNLPVNSETILEKNSTVSKRFVFDAIKIDELKAMVCSKVNNPTRVQVVTALIYKCAIVAASKLSCGTCSNPSGLVQTMNLRNRMVPPLPSSLVGNLHWFFQIVCENDEIELYDLVNKMKENMASFCSKYAKKFREGEWELLFLDCLKDARQLLRRDNLIVYKCSSWCKFPMYEADFGWGKPKWVSIANFPLKNSIIMMDDRSGDGIEAFVNLGKEEMDLFEADIDLLAFASLNPSVLE